jgi:hypothetical protein
MFESNSEYGCLLPLCPRMLEFVKESMTSTERQKKSPALRLKSYLLQEAEAVSTIESRQASVVQRAWCKCCEPTA